MLNRSHLSILLGQPSPLPSPSPSPSSSPPEPRTVAAQRAPTFPASRPLRRVVMSSAETSPEPGLESPHLSPRGTKRFHVDEEGTVPSTIPSSVFILLILLFSAADDLSRRKRGRPPKHLHHQPSPPPFLTTDVLDENQDEYLDRETDEAGEKKVDSYGYLADGRRYKFRTFTLPGRSKKLFILATECARVLGFRDSFCLFHKNPSLFKIIATKEDKDALIEQNVLPYSYRGRQIAVLTARSMFRQFGSRIIANGRRIRDDYWETRARKQGYTDDDFVPKRPKRTYPAPKALVAEEANTLYIANDESPDLPAILAPLPSETTIATPATDPRLRNFLNARSQQQRRNKDILGLGAPWQDRSTPSSTTDITQHASNAAEFSRALNAQRSYRCKGMENRWRSVERLQQLKQQLLDEVKEEEGEPNTGAVEQQPPEQSTGLPRSTAPVAADSGVSRGAPRHQSRAASVLSQPPAPSVGAPVTHPRSGSRGYTPAHPNMTPSRVVSAQSPIVPGPANGHFASNPGHPVPGTMSSQHPMYANHQANSPPPAAYPYGGYNSPSPHPLASQSQNPVIPGAAHGQIPPNSEAWAARRHVQPARVVSRTGQPVPATPANMAYNNPYVGATAPGLMTPPAPPPGGMYGPNNVSGTSNMVPVSSRRGMSPLSLGAGAVPTTGLSTIPHAQSIPGGTNPRHGNIINSSNNSMAMNESIDSINPADLMRASNAMGGINPALVSNMHNQQQQYQQMLTQTSPPPGAPVNPRNLSLGSNMSASSLPYGAEYTGAGPGSMYPPNMGQSPPESATWAGAAGLAFVNPSAAWLGGKSPAVPGIDGASMHGKSFS